MFESGENMKYSIANAVSYDISITLQLLQPAGNPAGAGARRSLALQQLAANPKRSL